MSCGVGRRHSLDPALLWLCCRPAAAALIQPRAWELPYVAGATLKRQKIKIKTGQDLTIVSRVTHLSANTS